jgi:hypothetical protein
MCRPRPFWKSGQFDIPRIIWKSAWTNQVKAIDGKYEQKYIEYEKHSKGL